MYAPFTMIVLYTQKQHYRRKLVGPSHWSSLSTIYITQINKTVGLIERVMAQSDREQTTCRRRFVTRVHRCDISSKFVMRLAFYDHSSEHLSHCRMPTVFANIIKEFTLPGGRLWMVSASRYYIGKPARATNRTPRILNGISLARQRHLLLTICKWNWVSIPLWILTIIVDILNTILYWIRVGCTSNQTVSSKQRMQTKKHNAALEQRLSILRERILNARSCAHTDVCEWVRQEGQQRTACVRVSEATLCNRLADNMLHAAHAKHTCRAHRTNHADDRGVVSECQDCTRRSCSLVIKSVSSASGFSTIP